MRILLTTETIGGVWTYALELCSILPALGVEVVLAAVGPTISAAQVVAAGRLRGVELDYRRTALEWMDDPWLDVERTGEWLLALADRYGVSLVHANSYTHASLPFGRPVVLVGHACLLSWLRAVQGPAVPEHLAEYRERVQAGLRAADLVVAPTQWMLDALTFHYGGLLHRAVVIPNGRRFGLFEPDEKRGAVVSIGRVWDEAKNLAALSSVAPRLPWPVRIAGDVEHPGGTRAELAHVTLLGELTPEQLAGELGRADIYALPARYEPFGWSVLEAALSRCALVLGDIASLRELWTGAAWFVSPDDDRELAWALTRLIEDRRTREQLARTAETRARTFGAVRMSRTYVHHYEALVHTPTFDQAQGA